jgi:hypothetical protein
MIHIAQDHRTSGRYEEALEAYFAALAANPDAIDVQFGNPVGETKARPIPPEKELNCDSITEGKVLLVYYAKGHGDTLQFLRFLPTAVEQLGLSKILFLPQAALTSLVRNSLDPLTVEVLDPATNLADLAYDYHTHLLSLPHLLSVQADAIPSQGRYLNGDTTSARTFDPTIRKIGLVWQGDPTHVHDPDRSIPLQRFIPLLSLPNTLFYSLQVGHGRDQIGNLPLEDLAPDIHSFADLAALMDEMDLIVTIDTAAAHLASGLAKPTYVLLPKNCDLRWAGETKKGFWSASTTLLRQQQQGQWDDVVQTLYHELLETGAK